MSKKSFTVVGNRHYGYDSQRSLVYYFEANDARDAVEQAYAHQADCQLRAYFESSIRVARDVEALSYDEALEDARNETAITAVFAGRHEDCFHVGNDSRPRN